MMDCVIRRAGQRDVEAIGNLWKEINNYHAAAMPHVFQQQQTVSDQQLGDWLLSEDNTFFAAEREGDVVGFVRCINKQSADSPLFVKRVYMVIEVLVVRSDLRKQGIGSQLMARAHQWALEQGINQIEIGVWEFNTNARHLYESMGYQTVSRKLWIKLS